MHASMHIVQLFHPLSAWLRRHEKGHEQKHIKFDDHEHNEGHDQKDKKSSQIETWRGSQWTQT